MVLVLAAEELELFWEELFCECIDEDEDRGGDCS